MNMGNKRYQHPQLGPVKVEAQVLSESPDRQVEQTLDVMGGYSQADCRSPLVQAWAQELGAGRVDPVQYCHNVHRFIRGLVKFVHDEQITGKVPEVREQIHRLGGEVVEVLVRPVDLLNTPGEAVGDCDDFSMLGASLLLAGGVPCRFTTVSGDGSGYWSHVYLAAYPHGKRLPIDASHGQYPGWETERNFRRKEWDMMIPYPGNPVPPGVSGMNAGMNAGMGGLGIDWDFIEGAINSGLTTAGNIFTRRYAVPETPAPGTMYRAADGSYISTTGASGAAGAGVTGISTGTLLLVGGAFMMMMFMMSQNRR